MANIAKKRVYLAGPITGEPHNAAWRQYTARLFKRHLVEVYDPTKARPAMKLLQDEGTRWIPPAGGVELLPLGMAARNYAALRESDLVFASFPDLPERQAVEALMELGMAVPLGIPAVVVCSFPVFADTLYIRAFVEHVVDHVDEGVDRAVAILHRQARSE